MHVPTGSNENKQSGNGRKEKTQSNSLDFIATCHAIREGKLTVGIVVSHPKVAKDIYVVTEDDYDTEEDNEDEDVVLDAAHRHHDSDSDEEEEKKQEEQQKHDSSSDEDIDDKKVINNHGRILRVDSTAIDLTLSFGNGVSTAIHRAYGSRAEDMTKFYDIMHKAETGSNDIIHASRPQSIETAVSATIFPVQFSSLPSIFTAHHSSSSPASSDHSASKSPIVVEGEQGTGKNQLGGKGSRSRPVSIRSTIVESSSAYTEFNFSHRRRSGVEDAIAASVAASVAAGASAAADDDNDESAIVASSSFKNKLRNNALAISEKMRTFDSINDENKAASSTRPTSFNEEGSGDQAIMLSSSRSSSIVSLSLSSSSPASKRVSFMNHGNNSPVLSPASPPPAVVALSPRRQSIFQQLMMKRSHDDLTSIDISNSSNIDKAVNNNSIMQVNPMLLQQPSKGSEKTAATRKKSTCQKH